MSFAPLVLLLPLVSLLHSSAGERVVYSIETTWDGQPITDHDFATVALDVDEEGRLTVEASAPFFNSPIPPEELVLDGGDCPQRPHGALYNYEGKGDMTNPTGSCKKSLNIISSTYVQHQVVEAFFLNDDDRYLELEFSPQGLYLFIMLDGYRNDVLSLLPLMPEVCQPSRLFFTIPPSQPILAPL